jgi:hypothetical protein
MLRSIRQVDQTEARNKGVTRCVPSSDGLAEIPTSRQVGEDVTQPMDADKMTPRRHSGRRPRTS